MKNRTIDGDNWGDYHHDTTEKEHNDKKVPEIALYLGSDTRDDKGINQDKEQTNADE